MTKKLDEHDKLLKDINTRFNSLLVELKKDFKTTEDTLNEHDEKLDDLNSRVAILEHSV